VLPLVGVAVLCLLAAGAIAGWYLTRDGDPPADDDPGAKAATGGVFAQARAEFFTVDCFPSQCRTRLGAVTRYQEKTRSNRS
jgi:hypothetical protein